MGPQGTINGLINSSWNGFLTCSASSCLMTLEKAYGMTKIMMRSPPSRIRTVGMMSRTSLQVTPRYQGSFEMASSCEVVFDRPDAPDTIETRSAAVFPSSTSEALLKADPPRPPPRSFVCLYLGKK